MPTLLKTRNPPAESRAPRRQGGARQPGAAAGQPAVDQAHEDHQDWPAGLPRDEADGPGDFDEHPEGRQDQAAGEEGEAGGVDRIEQS